MANLYGKSQTLEFLTELKAKMAGFEAFVEALPRLFDEWTRMGLSDLTADDIANSTFSDLSTVEVVTAMGAAKAVYDKVIVLADIAAHRQQMATVAQRR